MNVTQVDSLIEPSVDNLLKKVENKYILSLLAAKRARELFDGDEPLTDTYYINKVTTAIHEIYEGKIRYQKHDEHTV